MLEAFGLGVLAQSSLLIAGVVVCWVTVPSRIIGILGGYGAGALLAAVAFDLVPESADLSNRELVTWMLIGVTIFLVGDELVERRFGEAGAGAAMGIVVGSVVDGVPECAILGVQFGTGMAISASFVAAIFVSNIPQAMAPSADLAAAGWSWHRLGGLWALVVAACGAASALGFLATENLSTVNGDRAAALAAGGLLAMLTNSLIPFSFERGRALAGAATALGFCLGLLNT